MNYFTHNLIFEHLPYFVPVLITPLSKTENMNLGNENLH